MRKAGAADHRTKPRALRWACAGAVSLAAHLVAAALLTQTPSAEKPPPAPAVELTLIRLPDREPELHPAPPEPATGPAAAATASPAQSAAAAQVVSPSAPLLPSGPIPPLVEAAPPRAEAAPPAQLNTRLSCAEAALLPVSLRPTAPCEKQAFLRAGSLDRQTFAFTPNAEDALIAAHKAARRQEPRLAGPPTQRKAKGPCQGANLGIGCPPELPLVLVRAGGAPKDAPDVPPPLIGK